MKTKIKKENKQGVVKAMRQIRDEISKEIMDMTFEQERAHLNKLLSKERKSAGHVA